MSRWLIVNETKLFTHRKRGLGAFQGLANTGAAHDQNDIDGSERECRGLIGLTKCVPLHVFPNAGNTFERKVK